MQQCEAQLRFSQHMASVRGSSSGEWLGAGACDGEDAESSGASGWAEAACAFASASPQPPESSDDDWGACAASLDAHGAAGDEGAAAVAVMVNDHCDLDLATAPKRRRGRPTKGEQILARAAEPPHAALVAVAPPRSLAVAGIVQEPPAAASVAINEGSWLRLRRAPRLSEPHPLSSTVAVAYRNATLVPDKVDQATVDLAHRILGESQVRVGSHLVFVESTGTSRDRALPRQRTVVSSLYIACRSARWDL